MSEGDAHEITKDGVRKLSEIERCKRDCNLLATRLSEVEAGLQVIAEYPLPRGGRADASKWMVDVARHVLRGDY